MFRSGPLDRRKLNAIVAKVSRHPHNLRAVAKACMIYPADLMAWYVIGQEPGCAPIYAELAWKINEARFEHAARNLERIEAAANGGTKRKVVTKPGPAGEGEIEEVTVEDVLPQAWAIEKLEEMAAGSHWEISPNAEQADELHRMMAELAPTPLLGPGGPPEGSPIQACDLGSGVGSALEAGDGVGAAPVKVSDHEVQIPDGAPAHDLVGQLDSVGDVVHDQTLTDGDETVQ